MKKPVLLAVVIAAAVASLWSAWRGPAPSDAAAGLVADRVWLDRVPRSERDTVNMFVLIGQSAVDVFHTASAWRGSFEAFRYELSGSELRVLYPHSGDRETVRARARRCTEPHMDFCLELQGASRGVARYYSRKGWEIRGAHDAGALAHELDRRISALVAAPGPAE